MPPKKKKVTGVIKLQIKAGAANPAPPIGPALGAAGVNIMEFCKAYNAATEAQRGNIIPVEITVYEDRSFTFITKTPPAAELIKKAAGIEKGSGEPHTNKVATITRDQVRSIAETKMADLNANDLDAGLEDHRRHRPQHGRHRRRLTRPRTTSVPPPYHPVISPSSTWEGRARPARPRLHPLRPERSPPDQEQT